MTETHNYRTLLVVSIAVLTAIGLGLPAVAAQENGTPTPTDGAETPTPTQAGNATTPTPAGADNVTSANVSFGNQTSNGTSVTINSTTLPEGGFVLVYTLNETAFEDGAAAAETPTEAANVTMAAENETAATAAENETVAVGAENETATPAAGNATPTTAGDGTPTPTPASAVGVSQVNVTSVEEINASVLGIVVGNSSYLESGTQENVTVQFDGRMVEDQVLIAVAYQDMDANQQYDGLEIEAPYFDDQNQIVADQAYVTVMETENATAGATPTPTEAGNATTPTETGAGTPTEAGAGTPTEGGAGTPSPTPTV